VEWLEDRDVPSAPVPDPPNKLLVTTHLDVVAQDGKISLREAVNFANGQVVPGQQQITFASNVYNQAINLQANQLELQKSIHINGVGTGITVQRDASTGDFRLFEVKESTIICAIGGLTLKNGLADYGGAILSRGNLTLTSCTLQSNQATTAGGWGYGGAIRVHSGTLDVSGCTFTDNSAKYGGAIDLWGATSVTISDSTISLNYASDKGGAIYGLTWDGALTLDDVDMAGNIAVNAGGGIYISDGGVAVPNIQLVLSGGTNIHSIVVHSGSGQGGGVYLKGGKINYVSVTVGYNDATTGDGLYLSGVTEENLPNLVLQGGDARYAI
jgi:hypothetical protein